MERRHQSDTGQLRVAIVRGGCAFSSPHTCVRVIGTGVLEGGYVMLPINSEHAEVGWVDQVGLHFPNTRRRLLPSGVPMPTAG